jgi:dTDP-4-amino-4,6-dideoxygalactose transaminase
MSIPIPFNKSFETGRELKYVADVLKNHSTSGDGVYTNRCQELMQNAFSAKKVLLTTSCTSALEMSVMLCNLQPGDEVILPSFTFVSTANALVLNGVVPRFVDIRPDTKNLDEELIADSINDRTKAILPVHYAGVSCDMNAIQNIARKHRLRVIEDAAQGVNATIEGRYLGTLGNLGAYSFHETKNYSSGEGGALLINDESMVERAEILREKGTDRSRFNRGQVDKYSWVDIGSSFLPSDILAAVLLAQLESLDEINTARKLVYDRYLDGLKGLASEGHIELPFVPENCRQNYHMFYILVEDLRTRSALIEFLKGKGIHAVFHYVPLHNSPMGIKLGTNVHELPVTQSVSNRLLRLPFFCGLEESDTNYICNEISTFFRR